MWPAVSNGIGMMVCLPQHDLPKNRPVVQCNGTNCHQNSDPPAPVSNQSCSPIMDTCPSHNQECKKPYRAVCREKYWIKVFRSDLFCHARWLACRADTNRGTRHLLSHSGVSKRTGAREKNNGILGFNVPQGQWSLHRVQEGAISPTIHRALSATGRHRVCRPEAGEQRGRINHLSWHCRHLCLHSCTARLQETPLRFHTLSAGSSESEMVQTMRGTSSVSRLTPHWPSEPAKPIPLSKCPVYPTSAM